MVISKSTPTYYAISNDFVANAVAQYISIFYQNAKPFYIRETKTLYKIYTYLEDIEIKSNPEWDGVLLETKIEGPFQLDNASCANNITFFVFNVKKEDAYRFYTNMLSYKNFYKHDFKKGMIYYYENIIAPIASEINNKLSPVLFVFSGKSFKKENKEDHYLVSIDTICLDLRILDTLYEFFSEHTNVSIMYSPPKNVPGSVLPHFLILFHKTTEEILNKCTEEIRKLDYKFLFP